MPEGSHHGTFALAVWNEAIEAESLESDKALVNLVNVSGYPNLYKRHHCCAETRWKMYGLSPTNNLKTLLWASSSDSTWINAKSQVRGVGPSRV